MKARAVGFVPRALDTFAPPQMRDWAREGHRERRVHLERLAEADLAAEVRFPWADRLVERFGKAEPARSSEGVVQLARHSSYHRGQIARRRELGAEPPLTDFIARVWTGRPGPSRDDVVA